MDAEETVRAYYDALDAEAYERLTELLAPEFAQRRPDRALVGRDAFVRFMREERPVADATHELATVYRTDGPDEYDELAARGTVRSPGGDSLVEFVDVFTLEDGEIQKLETYTR
jgi:ketosteroid isomerase-like protein